MAELIDESDELRLKRFEELYSLTKYGVKTGIERYRLQDEKSAKYLTALNLLLAIVAFVGKEALTYILPCSHVLDYLCVGLESISILLLLSSLGAIVRVISMKQDRALREPPVSLDLIDLFKSNDYITSIFAMSRTNVEVVSANQESTRSKATTLQIGSNCLFAAVICFGLFIGLFSARLMLYPLPMNTAQKTQVPSPSTAKNGTPSSESSAGRVPLPNTSVRPLKPAVVSEGATPAPPKTANPPSR